MTNLGYLKSPPHTISHLYLLPLKSPDSACSFLPCHTYHARAGLHTSRKVILPNMKMHRNISHRNASPRLASPRLANGRIAVSRVDEPEESKSCGRSYYTMFIARSLSISKGRGHVSNPMYALYCRNPIKSQVTTEYANIPPSRNQTRCRLTASGPRPPNMTLCTGT